MKIEVIIGDLFFRDDYTVYVDKLLGVEVINFYNHDMYPDAGKEVKECSLAYLDGIEERCKEMRGIEYVHNIIPDNEKYEPINIKCNGKRIYSTLMSFNFESFNIEYNNR